MKKIVTVTDIPENIVVEYELYVNGFPIDSITEYDFIKLYDIMTPFYNELIKKGGS